MYFESELLLVLICEGPPLQFVSVASQADTERADVEKERKAQETAESREVELKELAAIYRARGLQPALALEVARQLSAHDVVRAHARDECEPAALRSTSSLRI